MKWFWFGIEKACSAAATAQVALANVPLMIGNVFCALANAARMKKMICERNERNENTVP